MVFKKRRWNPKRDMFSDPVSPDHSNSGGDMENGGLSFSTVGTQQLYDGGRQEINISTMVGCTDQVRGGCGRGNIGRQGSDGCVAFSGSVPTRDHDFYEDRQSFDLKTSVAVRGLLQEGSQQVNLDQSVDPPQGVQGIDYLRLNGDDGLSAFASGKTVATTAENAVVPLLYGSVMEHVNRTRVLSPWNGDIAAVGVFEDVEQVQSLAAVGSFGTDVEVVNDSTVGSSTFNFMDKAAEGEQRKYVELTYRGEAAHFFSGTAVDDVELPPIDPLLDEQDIGPVETPSPFALLCGSSDSVEDVGALNRFQPSVNYPNDVIIRKRILEDPPTADLDDCVHPLDTPIPNKSRVCVLPINNVRIVSPQRYIEADDVFEKDGQHPSVAVVELLQTPAIKRNSDAPISDVIVGHQSLHTPLTCAVIGGVSSGMSSHRAAMSCLSQDCLTPIIDRETAGSSSASPSESVCSLDNSPDSACKSTLFQLLGKFHSGSLQFVAKSQRKRRKVIASTSKRKKRSSDKAVYSNEPALHLQRQKKRYQTSPAFARRIIQRVYDFNLYKSSLKYRQSVKQRASQRVKAKYAVSSPFRRRAGKLASARYKSLPNSSIKRLRDRQRVCRRASNTRAKRKIDVHNPERRAKYNAYFRNRREEMKRNANKKMPVGSDKTYLEPVVNALIKRKDKQGKKFSAPPLPPLNKKSAEYQKGRFSAWKRYKINQLMAHCKPVGNNRIQKIARTVQKYEARRLLHQVLSIQRSTRSLLYQKCFKITKLHQSAIDTLQNVPVSEKSNILASYYGKDPYHVQGKELDGPHEYGAYLVAFPEEKETCTTRQEILQVRMCDEKCASRIPDNWSLVLHERLQKFNSNLKIQQLLHNIYLSEECNSCDAIQGFCHSSTACSDLIRYLLLLQVHYVGIRTLLRDLYKVRQSALELHVIELLFIGGTYSDMAAFVAKRNGNLGNEDNDEVTADTGGSGQPGQMSSDKVVNKEFGRLAAAFEEAVKNSMEVHECHNCLRLVDRLHISSFDITNKFCKDRNDIKMMIQNYQGCYGDIIGCISLCKSCVSDFKQKTWASFSCQNKMWPSPVPAPLQRLNPYERQLISLSKSFQRIVKLHPYSYRGPNATLVRAVKGLAIHLPLPTGTVEKVSSTIQRAVTLPDCSNFLIQVDCLPNLSKKLLFRSLVDISSVMEALGWLKKHNALYQNVIVDQSFLLLDDERKLPQVVAVADDDDPQHLIDDAPWSNGSAIAISEVELESRHVQSKRKVRKREESYFQHLMQSGEDVEANGAPAGVEMTLSGQVHAASTEPMESNHDNVGTSRATVCAGGSEAQAAVTAMNFPVPYVIPYKQFLLEQLQDNSSMLMHVPEDDVLEQFSIVQMEKSLPNLPDLELFAMKPVLASPLYWDDPLVDVASFPHLFPDGVNGVFEDRTRTVTPAFYMEHRFRMRDPRFRRDLIYLFDCAIRKDMMSINSSIYTMLNVGQFGRVTAGDLKKGVTAPGKSSTLERNVSTMLGNIVGTPQYWRRVRYDLEAVIEQYGPATFFFTASCAEYKLDDFREFLILRNTDLPNVRNTSVRNLISIDPISVALHFHKKFMCFWDEVIVKEKGPLGCVEHYYIRKEYQQRGAPHMHVLLWIRNAPVHGQDDDEAVLNFICSKISCAIPDPVTSPLLNALVTGNQLHCCTGSCLRTKSVKGKYFSSYCRYGFPRIVCTTAELYSVKNVLEAKASGRGRKKLYALPRTVDEIMVNDYNPALLSMWGANIDIQYIHDNKQCLVYYTTVYLCKSEKQSMSKVAATINTSLSAAGMAKQMACLLMKSRQLGAYEAADKVLRHPLYRLSEEVKSVCLYMPGEQRRRLKTKAQLECLESDSMDVFCKSFQSAYYPQRPSALDDCSVYEVMRNYDYKYGKPVRNQTLYMPSLNAYYSTRRQKAVLKLYKPWGDDPQALERYCFQLVALFKPWRKEEELLKDMDGNSYSTYTEVYTNIRARLPEMQRFESSREKLTDMIEWADKIKADAQKVIEAQVASGINPPGSDVVGDSVQALDLELCQQSEQVRNRLTAASVKEKYQQLNTVQKEAFDLIMEQISDTDHQPGSLVPKKVFVSGVGGTGKSFLIMALRHHIEFNYSSDKGPAVLVAAPTGVAAANVDGVTIHKLLKLPVSKSKDSCQVYWSLHPQDRKILRMLFANVKLVIIDEVSMLSNMFLLFVHKRLNEVLIEEDKDPYARFGNLNVLLLGDLLQLPPVNAPHVFQSVTRKQFEGSFRSLGGNMPLWGTFEFVELTENMRQRDDAVYASMLDRIRIGSPTEDDLSLLRTRLIVSQDTIEDVEWTDLLRLAADKFLVLLQDDLYALCLMPLNELTAAFNQCIMDALQLQAIICRAEDVADAGRNTSSRRKSRKKKNNTSAEPEPDDILGGRSKKLLTVAETGGLEEELTLAVGARVMLRRNIDVKQKLVNGSIGFVRRIDVHPDSNKPEIINVQFQSLEQLTPIKKMKVKYCIGANLFIERSQFPLTLAYAITIHKCQGLSLQSAMVDLGPGTFSDGMGYVALSRVKKLENLHLIRLSGGKLKCDGRCVKEYNRLRTITGIVARIQGYNQNPEFEQYRKATVVVSSVQQKVQLQEEMELTSVSLKRPRVEGRSVGLGKSKAGRGKGKDICLTSASFLKFRNTDGHSCFANSAVQCILQCNAIYTPLQQTCAGVPVAEELLALFHRHVAHETQELATDSLRQAFGVSSQFSMTQSGNCDPIDFLTTLISALPVQVADKFSHFKSLSGVCPNRSCRAKNDVQHPTEQHLNLVLRWDGTRYEFNHVFRIYSEEIHRCFKCRVLYQQFPVKAEYTFPSSNKYLWLTCPVMMGGRMIGKTLTGMRVRNLLLYGQRWNVIGCIQVSGSTPSFDPNYTVEFMARDDAGSRHYVAFVPYEKASWVRLSDGYRTLLNTRPKLENMVLFLLERITRS